VQVVRKAIKNLHLGVYPPAGRVRVAAPMAMNDAAVRLAVVRKLGWIRRQRAAFEAQPRQSKREMVTGESHYYLGRRYRLRVVDHQRAGSVVLRHGTVLELQVRGEPDAAGRERVLLRWYRERLRDLVPSMLAKWERMLGVRVAEWGIKRMKTRWGGCNRDSRRVWLNLELAKKPVKCVEYVVVHELVHLLVRHHDDRFIALMNQHLPSWRHRRREMAAAPLGHARWKY
jgi:predicted metal-dependent hydrolase